MVRQSRRRFLAVTGIGLAGVAGCGEPTGEGEEGGGESGGGEDGGGEEGGNEEQEGGYSLGTARPRSDGER